MLAIQGLMADNSFIWARPFSFFLIPTNKMNFKRLSYFNQQHIGSNIIKLSFVSYLEYLCFIKQLDVI